MVSTDHPVLRGSTEVSWGQMRSMAFVDFFEFWGNLRRRFRIKHSFYTNMAWNEVIEPSGHRRSTTSYDPKMIFFLFFVFYKSLKNRKKLQSFVGSKGWKTVFAHLLEVDAGAYSKAWSGGRNNCTMREENRLRKPLHKLPCIWIGTRIHFAQCVKTVFQP